MAIIKVREIELRNVNNIYVSPDFILRCDDEGMHLNVTFGRVLNIIINPEFPSVLINCSGFITCHIQN